MPGVRHEENNAPLLNKWTTGSGVGSGLEDPYVLDLGTSWRWVVSFTLRTLHLEGKSPRYLLFVLESRLGWSTRRKYSTFLSRRLLSGLISEFEAFRIGSVMIRLQKVLSEVYENHWIYGICKSSGILKLINITFRNLDFSPSWDERNGARFLWSLRKS
jgi:hypothetical protein